jgi:zinc protease
MNGPKLKLIEAAKNMCGAFRLRKEKETYMKRKFTLTLIVLFTIYPHVQSAQQVQKSPDVQARPSGDIPGVDNIINKYVQAIGGVAAHQKLTSRVMKGTFIIPDKQNMPGTFEAYEKAPNKSLVVINFPGGGIIREGYNGVIGWSQESQEEVRVMTGAELISTKVDSDFYKEIRLPQIFRKLTFKSTEKVGNILTHKLEGTTEDGYSETMYFAVESGLLVRTDLVEESPAGKIALELHFEDYREVDGIKIPFTVSHRSPEFSIIFKINEVKHNGPIEDEKFEKPRSSKDEG